MEHNSNTPPRRKPRIKLPFERKKVDIGEWAYAHRVALCITIIAYLSFAIVFVCTKIFVGTKPHTQGIYIDLNELAELEEIRDRLQEELNKKQQSNWSDVQNKTSNENASNEAVKDDRGTKVEELNASASENQKSMEANRKAYEKGLAEAEALRSKKGNNGTDNNRQDQKIKGSVTVSFSLTNPLRHSRDLIIPAYRCEGGDEVIVDIIVNNAGRVISAKTVSGGDRCMRETAENAALNSRFDINTQAPERHRGQITYIFIPQ
ncbi:MAG: energy transducer TonB [Rikenellaceae bacterium]